MLDSPEWTGIRFCHRGCLIAVAAVMVLMSAESQAQDAVRNADFFESKIRPVLIEHCYSCHAANSDEIKGGLLLDSAAAVLQGGDSGPALVPGKPDASLLIEALRYDGLEMPPAGKLPEQIVRDFEKWVAMGAPDPRETASSDSSHPSRSSVSIEDGRQFWAFRPVQDQPLPKLPDQQSGTTIDAFVNAGLTSAGLEAVANADRVTLIRRLYFDLTGLPPDAAELSAALADTSDNAVETLVDRLLNSAQFGVHWGRHWLDVARYADSNGGDFNATFHNAWKYRNYVIEAFNSDMPFDQFVQEQIAGDLLPCDEDAQRTRQLIATGFLMVGTKMLSERDKDKLTMDTVDEQISTIGSAVMGLTLGCARCHDHKFDPIPTRDYYALAGIFRSTQTLKGESQKYVSTWQRTSLPTEPEHIARVKAWEDRQQEINSALTKAKKHLKTLEQRRTVDTRLQVDDADAVRVGQWTASTLTPGFVGAGYIHDNNEGKGVKSVEFAWTPPRTAKFEVQVTYNHGPTRAATVPVQIRHADGETNVVLDQTKPPEVNGRFTVVGRFPFRDDSPASVSISNAGTKGFVIVDAVRFVELDDAGKVVTTPMTEADGPGKAELEAARQKITSLESEARQLKKDTPTPLPMAIAATDLPSVSNCEICIRGEHRNRGPEVPRGFLQVAEFESQPVVAEDESGRRQLAEWLTSPRHPLTARVIVNRIWQHLLGEGIVRTVDNFGRLGERPTHPELLDHLACRFVTDADDTTALGSPGLGWSVKALVREIVLTKTYQRSSAHSDRAWQTDPDNRLLWKANRRRISAESLRDAILKISGQLDLSPGGSPVEGLGTLVSTNDANAEEYERQQSIGRSVYLPIIRNELPPILTAFDFADPDLVVGKRPVTSVPAQALLLLNSPFIMDSAERTAEELCRDTSLHPGLVIRRTYTAVLCREPTEHEVKRAMNFLGVTDTNSTIDNDLATDASSAAEPFVTRLKRFIHVLFASTEFRMLD